MRFVLGAPATAAIAGVAFVQPAEARCFFNGFDTVCVHHAHPFGMYRDFDRPAWCDYGYRWDRW